MKRKNYDPRAAIKNSKKHSTIEPIDQALTGVVENREMAQPNNEDGHKNPHGVQMAEHPNPTGEAQLA